MTDVVPLKTPEETELEFKLAELGELEGLLAERELELADVQGQLSTFQSRYFQAVGARYRDLDRLNLEIAERLVGTSSGDSDAEAVLEGARRRAAESAGAMGDVDDAPVSREEPSSELRRLYRQVARQVHPDLALDEADRARRTTLMARANAAYAARDMEAMLQVLRDAASLPDAIRGDDVAAKLVRAIRNIHRARERLRQIAEELDSARASPMFALMARCNEAADAGRDLLAEMGGVLDADIAAAHAKL